MSFLETAVEDLATAGWLKYLKIAWKLLPWGLLVAALIALQATRGTLADVRAEQAKATLEAKAEVAAKEAEWAKQGQDASSDYADRLASLKPVILRSTDTVEKYAQTPEGRAPGLSADRVSAILEDRKALFATSALPSASRLRSDSDPAAKPDQR